LNLEAEAGLLSALINTEDFLATLPFKLSSDDFQEKSNKLLAKIILHLHDEGFSDITKDSISSTANDLGLSEFPVLTNNGELLDKLCEVNPSLEEATLFLKQVKKEALREYGVGHIKKLITYWRETSDPLSKMIAFGEDTILKLTSSSDYAENSVTHLPDEKVSQSKAAEWLLVNPTKCKELEDKIMKVVHGT